MSCHNHGISAIPFAFFLVLVAMTATPTSAFAPCSYKDKKHGITLYGSNHAQEEYGKHGETDADLSISGMVYTSTAAAAAAARTRRDFLCTSIASATAGLLVLPASATTSIALAGDTATESKRQDQQPSSSSSLQPPQTQQEIYVGCGCFWHLQHSVAVFERNVLGRTGNQLTCQTGYAGGKTNDNACAPVCYHNAENKNDYGLLGHGEVVRVVLPLHKNGRIENMQEFVQLYLAQFDPKTKGMLEI